MKKIKKKWKRITLFILGTFLILIAYGSFQYYFISLEANAWNQLEKELENSTKSGLVTGLWENKELKEGNYTFKLRKKNSINLFFNKIRSSSIANNRTVYPMISLAESITVSIIDRKKFDYVIGFSIYGSGLTGKFLEKFPVSKSVQRISLNGPHYSSESLEIITKYPNLKSLWIIGPTLKKGTAKYFRKSENLTSITLICPKVSETVFEQFPELDNLQSLNVSEISISENSFKQISLIPNLRRLNARETTLNNKGLKHLSNSSGLAYLDIGLNPIDDEGVKHLSKLNKLNFLLLSTTLITDDSLKLLGELPNLENLYLFNTMISDQGINDLRNSSTIKNLQLGKAERKHYLGRTSHYTPESITNKITDESIPYFLAMSNLKSLYIEGSEITPEGRKRIKSSLYGDKQTP